MIDAATAPIHKQVEVPLAPADAFDLFTARMGTWWPLSSHSVFGDDAVRCVMEPRQGGRIYEASTSGEENEWGTVNVWEPPARVVFSWNPNPTRSTFTEVEVTFTATDTGTRVDLEHRAWERMLSVAPELRDSYVSGWDPVLEDFRVAAAR